MNRLSVWPLLATVGLFSGCHKDGGGNPPPPAGPARCEVDLKGSGLFAYTGTGASAKVIDGDAMLIGGEGATGRKGDVLLANDRIHVIVEQPGRSVGPLLSGGGIIDADVLRGSAPGQDAFGRMELIYALGRISSVKKVEVLADGSQGGPAVVAATGIDKPHDLLNLQSMVKNQAGLDVQFVIDPNKPVNVRTTTYYVLSPGENRVRMLTAFCNDGDTGLTTPLVDLMDVGAFELFFPGGCSGGLGGELDAASCLVQNALWYGSQGDGVAYGVRDMSLADLKKPVTADAEIGYGGVVGAFVEGTDFSGILSWTDANARTRPGTFGVRPHGTANFLRDFFVGKDLAEVSAEMVKTDGVASGTLDVSVTLPGGAAAVGARVPVIGTDGKMVTLMVTGADGHGHAQLAAGSYTISAATEGRLPTTALPVAISDGGNQTATIALAASHTLTVHITDQSGAPIPGKAAVMCASTPCPFDVDTWKQYILLNSPQNGAAAIGFVPVSGEYSFTLPPGQYVVAVSRGPEYSMWPDTWPNAGAAVDLTSQDQTVTAQLGKVIDSTGWMSADLHVHAVNSTDSAVGNAVRVSNFLSEGVDIMVSTDHEWVTDYQPTIDALGAHDLIASMIGEEITSFTHGHFNNYPITIDRSVPNGGAFDHAGGEDGPTLRMPQVWDGVHQAHPNSCVQLNHPRGGSGVLTQLLVDTATLATHGDPKDFGMDPAPDATANDTKLLGDGWDVIESANGPTASFAVLNDWMTFLSRGTVRTTSGVSDTHYAFSHTGGYARTYASVGADDVAGFSTSAFADAIHKHHAFVTNGPFLKVSAQRLDASNNPIGQPVGIGDLLQVGSGESVQLVVDVQAQEQAQIDRVEIYSFAPGRDALAGASNSEWPEGRILDKHVLDITNPTFEPVPGSMNLRRLHLHETFVEKPTADTWYVAMARGTTGNSLWPLHGDRPMAYSNAILIDADGSGAYDNFPLKPGQPLNAPPPKKLHKPTAQELAVAVQHMLEHKHE
ncbi:MAG: CehA/McbA family metallohydrolase [Myxococcaceae bacterium]